jgi:hypothetical protein
MSTRGPKHRGLETRTAVFRANPSYGTTRPSGAQQKTTNARGLTLVTPRRDGDAYS